MKVIVIGNGIAGFSAASSIRLLDTDCDVTMISAETTPLYSACVLPDYISGKIPRERVFVKTIEDYERLGIQTLFGREVKEIDPIAKKVAMDNGKHRSYDNLILAMGSEATVLGERKEGIFKLKTLKDADEILNHNGKKAVVLGSGPTALEIGTGLSYRRYEVTIIARSNQVLRMSLDQKASDKVIAILEEQGINVRCGERVESVLGRERVKGLVTTKGELECDTLIWAVGMRPKVALAKKAGIEIGDKGGIKVNSHMETSNSGTYACGDCAESKDILTEDPSLNFRWSNANRQGSIAAHNLAGIPVNYPGSHKILNLDVFGNHIVGFGYTEASMGGLKERKPFKAEFSDHTIIEREKNGSYYRLVMAGDRCVGGQFINIGRDLGLLWSIMSRRRSIEGLLKMLDNKDVTSLRGWLHRVRPFLQNKPIQ